MADTLSRGDYFEKVGRECGQRFLFGCTCGDRCREIMPIIRMSSASLEGVRERGGRELLIHTVVSLFHLKRTTRLYRRGFDPTNLSP